LINDEVEDPWAERGVGVIPEKKSRKYQGLSATDVQEGLPLSTPPV
jgi:hypothetical protein